MMKEFLKTLRRLPDDVVLDMAAREIDIASTSKCVCGTAARLMVARRDNMSPDYADMGVPTMTLPELAGGSCEEWTKINHAYAHPTTDVEPLEEAFTLRVMEAAGV